MSLDETNSVSSGLTVKETPCRTKRASFADVLELRVWFSPESAALHPLKQTSDQIYKLKTVCLFLNFEMWTTLCLIIINMFLKQCIVEAKSLHFNAISGITHSVALCSNQVLNFHVVLTFEGTYSLIAEQFYLISSSTKE